MGRARGILAVLLASTLVLAAATCSDSKNTGDGGIEGDGGTVSCPAGVDKTVDTKTALALSAGKEETGVICPVKDQDYFKVTVPQGARLLRVKLDGTVPVTSVQLTYLVVKEVGSDIQTVASAPPWTGSGIRMFDAYHCLEPGTYFIVVKDDGDDAKDGNNTYRLSYSTEPDADTNEPNDDMATAKDIGKAGTISCKGDRDFYKVVVAANQLLEVSLKTTAATKVNLKYTILDDQKAKVAEDGNPDGLKGPTNLLTIHAVPKAGTYYIVVEDGSGTNSDPKIPYTLTATPKAEQDKQDQGTRNDTPATATTIDWAACQAGYTTTGQIGSKADVDYFKLANMPAGVTPDNPAVVEVTVDFGGTSQVDPQVGLVYGHAATTCAKDSCCRILKQSCTNEFNCLRESASCLKKDDIYCGDADCAPGAGLGCATEKACAGAVTCLPEKLCGSEQVSRYAEKGKLLRTAQPLLHAGPWYLRVTDYKNDNYEYGKSYTLTVKCRMAPDGASELNSEYMPFLVATTIGTEQYHSAAAKKKGLKATLGTWMTGHIEYEGDQDWYLLDHPCPGLDCSLTVNFKTSGNCPTGVQFVYTLAESDGKAWFAFPSTPTANQTGSYGAPAECLYALKKHGGAGYQYFFYVADLKHDAWSWDCTYSFQIVKGADGCNAPCKMVSGQCTS